MKTFMLVFLALLAVSLSEGHLISRKDDENKNNRISHGNTAVPGQFPWQVYMVFKSSSGSNYYCGASLISDQWVLTAAYCAEDAVQFTLTLGAISKSSSEEGTLKLVSTTAYVHPNYDSSNYNNNLALIKLPNSIIFSDRIRRIRLPSRGEILNGQENVVASGWGRTNDSSSSSSDVLQYVELTTISNFACKLIYEEEFITDSTVCCIGESDRSICSGDQGGALVAYDTTGEPVQVGISNFVSALGCTVGLPSGYVRTVAYLDWISDTTGEHFG